MTRHRKQEQMVEKVHQRCGRFTQRFILRNVEGHVRLSTLNTPKKRHATTDQAVRHLRQIALPKFASSHLPPPPEAAAPLRHRFPSPGRADATLSSAPASDLHHSAVQTSESIDRLCRCPLVSSQQTSSSFTIFTSVPLSLRTPGLSSEIAHQIYRQLAVRSSIRSCKRPQDLLVMVHDLPLSRRLVRLALLTIKRIRLGRAIAKMLDLPSFVCGAVNPTRGRGLNTVLP